MIKEYYEDYDFLIEDVRELSYSEFNITVSMVSNGQVLSMPVLQFQKINEEWKMIGIKDEF